MDKKFLLVMLLVLFLVMISGCTNNYAELEDLRNKNAELSTQVLILEDSLLLLGELVDEHPVCTYLVLEDFNEGYVEIIKRHTR